MSVNLTSAQRALLRRPLEEGHPFILLHTAADDRVARNLAAKGLGCFTNFRSQYSWRPRSGYFNHFTPNEEGKACR